ncbi:trypsin-1-like [Cimex lectularius]|uniref:Peptidase S1 domain-containing protein n=1 Tax=Cimex lectularius TaxID=79782 RepID=A0A8I6RRP6_CIMLE|nr:trypsin-1-like [Cimex lectularius]
MVRNFFLTIACVLIVKSKQENESIVRYPPGHFEAEPFKYYSVSNLSTLDFGFVFAPLPTLTQPSPGPDNGLDHFHFQWQPSTAPRPVRPRPERKPDSPIGYEVTCGTRRSNPSKDDIRIVGGINAEPGEFPWQVSLQLLTGWSARHICGGTIISKHWVVTAAHCVDGIPSSSLSVVAGDYDLYKVEGHEQRVDVKRVVTKGYRKGNFSNDIALLQVDALHLDGVWTAPLCVPRPYHNFCTGYATVTGWGRLSESGELPQLLQRVTLPMVKKKDCKQLYTNAGYSNFVQQCQICSGWEQGGYDSCQGDSGGPLACKRADGYYYLCGVVSWGVGCARPRYPGVYTEVACFSSWIRDIVYARNNRDISAISNVDH